MDSRKHRMWSRYHLALKMDVKCIRKIASEMCSEILLPRMSQGFAKTPRYPERYSTIWTTSKSFRDLELWKQQNSTSGLSKDNKGALMWTGDSPAVLEHPHEPAHTLKEMALYTYNTFRLWRFLPIRFLISIWKSSEPLNSTPPLFNIYAEMIKWAK